MRCIYILILMSFICCTQEVYGQHHSPIIIVYDISIKKNKNTEGIEETYNGGTKTLFSTYHKTRIRLTSLMRTESIFFISDTGKLQQAVMVKESGNQKYRVDMTESEWKDFNRKYNNTVCTFENDSILIAGYQCKKVIIKLSSGREITAYYTPKIKPANIPVEPAFTCIPGTVLQYTYTTHKGVIHVAASQILYEQLPPDIFTIPPGLQKRKYKLSEMGNED